MVKKNRSPIYAGSFYPKNKAELIEIINGFLSKTKKIEFGGRLKAVIVPHAGYVYSGEVAAGGFRVLKDFCPKKLF
mgnify:CR=1 FL=1